MATGPAAPGSSQYQQQLQQQAAAYGLTTDQYNQLVAQYPPTYTQNSSGGQYGMSAGGSYGQNPQLTSVLNSLSAAKQFGLGQQQQAPAPSSPGGVINDPTMGAVNLGAEALGRLGLSGPQGAYAVYNPTPGQAAMGGKGGSEFNKSGVNNVAAPTTSTQIPELQGGQLNVPGIFSKAPDAAGATQLNANGQLPGTPTGTIPANAPGARGPATPYATAPPAPGATAAQPPPAPGPQDAAAHNAALADAGMSMYSHMGGDPATATHSDIMDFHNQLTSSLQGLFGAGAAPGAVQNYTSSVAAPPSGLPATAATAGLKMSAGGMVPGRGNTDTVPAMLTPGEYVIPKAQAQQMSLPQVQRGPGPLRMDDGGYVPDPKDRDKPIPRSMTGQSTQSPGSTAGSGAPTGPQSSQSSINQPPAAPGAGASGTDWAKFAQQSRAYADQTSLANLGSGAYNAPAGNNALTVGDVANGAPTGAQVGVPQDLGQAPAAGAQTGAAMGAISDLANGLTKAAQTYAASFKDWQIQPDAIKKFGSNVGQQQTQEPAFKEEGS